MQQVTVPNKHITKRWIAIENLLNIVADSKTVTIPDQDSWNFYKDRSFSISMILQRPASVTTAKVFLCKRDHFSNDSTDIGWDMYFHSNGTHISWEAWNGIGYQFSTMPLTVPVGSLFLLTWSYDAATTTLRGYINGILGVTTSLASATTGYNNTIPISIGKVPNQSGYGYTGGVACLVLFNKALSQTEVIQMYDEKGLIPKTLHVNCVGYWTMQERYGDKIYDTVIQCNWAKGTKLIANHGTLVNYTNTELGIPTKTTQTSRLDFYTKATANYWNGSGNDLKTGYPDFTGAIFTKGSSNNSEIWMSSFPSGLSSLAGDYSLQVCWWNPGTPIVNSQSNSALVYDSIPLRVAVTDTNVTIICGNQNVTVADHIKGINAVTVSVNRSTNLGFIAVNNIRTTINGNIAGQTNFFSPTLAITSPAAGAMRLLGWAGNYISGIGAIAAAWNLTVITYREHLEFFKGTLLGNLTKRNMLWGVNANSINGSNQLVDLSGNGNNIQTYFYTADNLNPVHADYAIKQINTLR